MWKLEKVYYTYIQCSSELKYISDYLYFGKLWNITLVKLSSFVHNFSYLDEENRSRGMNDRLFPHNQCRMINRPRIICKNAAQLVNGATEFQNWLVAFTELLHRCNYDVTSHAGMCVTKNSFLQRNPASSKLW